MVRFGEVVVTYFVIGAVFWGAGLLDPADLGIVQLFFDFSESGAVQPSAQPQTLFEEMGNSIIDVAGGLVGPVLAIWNVLLDLIAFLFWPVTALQANGAPASVVVLLGGTPTVAFFVGVIRLVRESA